MRKLGLLLTLVTALLLAMAAPAAAKPGNGASGAAPGAANRPATDDAAASKPNEHDAQQQSGNGMNREGGPSTHPGNGWRDPGQDQGSPANTADPDCTGNRSSGAQATNIGACDDPAGAADKPRGSGGFDADKDWNNGCGNDTDFEDDNNARSGGPHPNPEHPPTPHPPASEQPKSERTSPPPKQPTAPEVPCVQPPPPTTKPPASNPPSQ